MLDVTDDHWIEQVALGMLFYGIYSEQTDENSILIGLTQVKSVHKHLAASDRNDLGCFCIM